VLAGELVGDALDVLEGPVITPDFAGHAGDAAVAREVLLRDGQDESIDVSGHGFLLGSYFQSNGGPAISTPARKNAECL